MSAARTANGAARGFSGEPADAANEGQQPTSVDPVVVLLLGPTGSGKTSLSLALAEEFNGEVVSCDSVAVYRGMDLGSAKPTKAERARVPHHLIDVADPDQPFTAGAYSRAARIALREIAARGRLPIVTGGTGLYLRALTEGLFAGPERQEGLRERLRHGAEKRGGPWLHRVLMRLDPSSAGRIHANDTPKLIRAIEVCLTGRRPMSEVLESEDEARDPLTGFRLLRIGLNPPRAALYERLNHRCADMFAAGLVQETRTLLACYGPVKALDSLGYRQACSMLIGGLSEKAAIAEAQQGHRNYAKRQITWFRREPDVHWIEGFGDATETLQFAKGLVENAVADAVNVPRPDSQ
jgi:tRNA dimethylallyltransferase